MSITFDLTGVGSVTMKGTGPWARQGDNIVDSAGIVSNPSVTRPFGGNGRGTKGNANVVWARADLTDKVVEAANAKLAEGAE
jgi:hypothetical protein